MLIVIYEDQKHEVLEVPTKVGKNLWMWQPVEPEMKIKVKNLKTFNILTVRLGQVELTE